jgi:hydroxymethylpyrimidine pyrophosphatase-like HAD family hydrolase
MGKKKAIIVDLDGTYSFVGDRSPYNGKLTMEVDKPHWAIIHLVESMRRSGYEIIFVSGRNENARQQTEKFIEHYGLMTTDQYQLHLKPNGDFRKDYLHKGEVYSKLEPEFNILFALEDRPSMIDFYRNEIGISCFGVSEYKDFKKRK